MNDMAGVRGNQMNIRREELLGEVDLEIKEITRKSYIYQAHTLIYSH